jgi:hypothetical protein
MASDAWRHMDCGVVSPERLGGKPSTRLAELATNGWSRLSKQKLYHILHAQVSTQPSTDYTWAFPMLCRQGGGGPYWAK